MSKYTPNTRSARRALRKAWALSEGLTDAETRTRQPVGVYATNDSAQRKLLTGTRTRKPLLQGTRAHRRAMQALSAAEENPDPLAYFASVYGVTFGRGRDIGIKKVLGGFSVWSEVGDYWTNVLDFDVGDGRSSNRRRRLIRAGNLYPVYEATASGTWTMLSSAGVGYTTAYCGGQSRWADAAGEYVEWDVTGQGDLYVIFTGRTDSGHCRVTINGSDALVNGLSDLGNGYKAFDTRTATDTMRRQRVKVASGLPSGTYTVRATVAGATTAPATNPRVFIEAAFITQRPSLCTRMEPPQWQSGVPCVIGQEFQNAGRFYRARSNGTTGATAPSHTSGVGSDGTIDYNVWTESMWHPLEWRTDYASEREYALVADIEESEDIGGQTHGNETRVSSTVLLDGTEVDIDTLSLSEIEWGARITLDDELTWTHPDDSSLADVTLTRVLTPGRMEVAGQATITTPAADLGWFYTGMHAGVAWKPAFGNLGFSDVLTDTGVTYRIADYAGANINQTTENVRGMAFRATFDVPFVSAVTQPAASNFLLRPNIESAANLTGATEWAFKGYFERASASAPESVSAGDVVTWRSVHAEGVPV